MEKSIDEQLKSKMDEVEELQKIKAANDKAAKEGGEIRPPIENAGLPSAQAVADMTKDELGSYLEGSGAMDRETARMQQIRPFKKVRSNREWTDAQTAKYKAREDALEAKKAEHVRRYPQDIGIPADKIRPR